MISLSSEDKLAVIEKIQKNPIEHIRLVQGVETTEAFQEKIFNAIANHERVVVQASHDVGKTWCASKIVLWFTSSFQGAKVITTAPTYNQVKRLLWSEIRSGFVKSKLPLGGEMLLTEWKIAEDWFAVGFTSRNEKVEGEGQGGASSFQGFHSRYILVIFDEATGISPAIWKQMEGLMTSGFVRFLAIGNPTTKSCEFYKCFSNAAYKKLKINCFDSPNFIQNGIPDLEALTIQYRRLKELSQDLQYEELQKYKIVNVHLITVKWVMQMILTWGLTHPLVVSKCFGEFPEEDEHTLIPLGIVQSAQFRSYPYQSHERVSIGVDVARFGTDKTVITELHGLQVTSRKVMVKRDANEICGEIVRRVNECKTLDVHVIVDATGVGSGVIDTLKEKRREKVIPNGVEIREVHFGASAGDKAELKEKFVNLKARMFILLAEDLKTHLCLPEEDVYLQELPTIQYRFDSKGRWQIESKEEYKSRTGRSSPDDADSLALANYGRYDHSGTGQFTRNLLPEKNGTIISHSRGQDLW